MRKDNILVISDDRPGNYQQALALAEGLHRHYEIKKIRYNFLAKLPNFLKFNKLLFGVVKNSWLEILNQKNPPQIIISSGRKNAPVALFLRKYYRDVFVIHLMNPYIAHNKFDLLIIPSHDNFQIGSYMALLRNYKIKLLHFSFLLDWILTFAGMTKLPTRHSHEGGNPVKREKYKIEKKINYKTKSDNIITSIGALSRINEDFLKQEKQKFATILNKISSPKIALLIGGASKNKDFNSDIADQLIRIINQITKNMSANLLVSTSKRTGQNLTRKLREKLNSHFFFEWQDGVVNPYFALLDAADYIITTGDSMSICSESCSTGKPVYIYNPKSICSDKHLRFHQDLFVNNYAKRLDETIKVLENYSANKLNETTRIANQIDKLLVLERG